MQTNNLLPYYYIGKTLEFYLEFTGLFSQEPSIYSLLHQNKRETTKIERKIRLRCSSPFKVCKAQIVNSNKGEKSTCLLAKTLLFNENELYASKIPIPGLISVQ